MTSTTTPPGALRLSVALLAVFASIGGWANQWAQDDMPIIWKNPAIHTLRGLPDFFHQPYWPKPFSQDLYRPMALATFALQWAAGDGAPILFRIVSYLLYAATAVTVFALARRILPETAAWFAAATFAVHPVHVEAVAMAVNQGELWVALLSMLATIQYLDLRRAGGPIPLRSILVIAGLYLLACLFKENALMLPGFLAAAELFLVAPGEPWAARLARGRPLLLTLMLVAVSFYGVRTLVLAGNLVGSFTAEALNGLDVRGRLLTMLPVVTEWLRLLAWPAHLQADYSPQEIVAQEAWGTSQTVGALVLVAAVLVAVAARRRAPAVTFGLAWMGIALFPVHNVLVPTGIVLAERTLFLPSVGFVLCLGALAASALPHLRTSALRHLGTALTALLLSLGIYRSYTRHPDWSDQFTLWYRTATVDAPLSYRAHHALAEMYGFARMEGHAEKEYRLAIALAPANEWRVYLDYANKLRAAGFCYPAVPLYEKALAGQFNDMSTRASLIGCLLNLGRYRQARAEARLAISFGWKTDTWRLLRELADSALRVNAPPGSLNFRMADDSVASYLRIGSSK